jgi:serine/threonine/tyrosine-interacting protein
MEQSEIDTEYYSLLQVDRNSTGEDIRIARNQRLRESRDDSSARALINEAYSVLSNDLDRQRYDRYGHCDMTEIRPRLFLGGESAASRPKILSANGIASVLSCAHSMHHLNKALVGAGIKHLQLDVEDSDEQNIIQYFDEAYSFIRDNLESGTAVLVHCQFGVSRSPSFLSYFLMKAESIPFCDALGELQQLRPQVCPAEGFQRQLNSLSCYLHCCDLQLILTDVTLRDGLQTEMPENWPLSRKKDLFHEIISEHNPMNIEVGSFASPKVLPIMQDTLEMFRYVEEFFSRQHELRYVDNSSSSVCVYVLVPSAGKFSEAFASHVVNFSFITSLSDAFQMKNTHKTLQQTKSELAEIDTTLQSKTKYKKKLYISCINECPILGRLDIDFVVQEILTYYHQYDFDEICLSDTCGSLQFHIFKEIVEKLKHAAVSFSKFSLHLHMNLESKTDLERIIILAILNGILRFDVSHLSSGGCSVTIGEDRCLPNLTYDFLHQVLSCTLTPT